MAVVLGWLCGRLVGDSVRSSFVVSFSSVLSCVNAWFRLVGVGLFLGGVLWVALVLFKELWRGIPCADFCRFATSVREGGTATPLLPHVNFGCEAPVPEFRTCLPSFRRPVCESSNLGSFRPSTSRSCGRGGLRRRVRRQGQTVWDVCGGASGSPPVLLVVAVDLLSSRLFPAWLLVKLKSKSYAKSDCFCIDC